MSHELRTPLHAILGFGELLERHDPRPDQREQLTQIMKAGRHLLELINEVLDLSRIDDGALRLSLEPVDVVEVVTETLEMLEPVANASAVRLAAPRFERPGIHVLADRQRLKQVLLNLLSNAVKYNREGGEVRVAGTTAAAPLTRIEVADTGLGIAPGDVERAFSAFERLGAETTDVEGTGLGLALTKRLIEAMGGTIGVESEVGRGTTFWIDLPEVSALDAAVPEQRRPAPPASVPLRTDARTVLYIEDNPSNIKLVETILRERPEVTLLVAQQGRLGLDLAREHAPALVLLDLNLPDISGEEILRRLRADERTASIPVVMVSADATVGQVARLRGGARTATSPSRLRSSSSSRSSSGCPWRAKGTSRRPASRPNSVRTGRPRASGRRWSRPRSTSCCTCTPTAAPSGSCRDLPRRLAGAPRVARARGARRGCRRRAQRRARLARLGEHDRGTPARRPAVGHRGARTRRHRPRRGRARRGPRGRRRSARRAHRAVLLTRPRRDAG